MKNAEWPINVIPTSSGRVRTSSMLSPIGRCITESLANCENCAAFFLREILSMFFVGCRRITVLKRLGDVQYRDIATSSFHAVAKLQLTPNVRGNNQFRVRAQDIFHLAVKNLHGQVGLRNIVSACASATLVGMFDLDDSGSDRSQELARLVLDLLTMQQVARVLIYNPFVQRAFGTS